MKSDRRDNGKTDPTFLGVEFDPVKPILVVLQIVDRCSRFLSLSTIENAYEFHFTIESRHIDNLERQNTTTPSYILLAWLRRQPPKVKVFLAVVSAIAALVVIRLVVYDHDNLFIAAEAVHALGISVLIYKLATEKTCAVPEFMLSKHAVDTLQWRFNSNSTLHLRFRSCEIFDLWTLDSSGFGYERRLLTALGYGMWPSLVLLSEIVQTSILADFCYFYQ
ncbi:hypothetical protein L1887_14469 [Cichorium endivia]|nr:hypothetical protein L1887_14469 [Cichorium endivia]